MHKSITLFVSIPIQFTGDRTLAKNKQWKALQSRFVEDKQRHQHAPICSDLEAVLVQEDNTSVLSKRKLLSEPEQNRDRTIHMDDVKGGLKKPLPSSLWSDTILG